MEKFKFVFIFIFILIIFGLMSYWAFTTIQSGDEYVSVEEINKLKEENERLTKELSVMSSELLTLKAEEDKKQSEPITTVVVDKTETNSVSEEAGAYKHQELIDKLQELIDDKVVMQLKSKGTRVGVVQEFLNLYNKTSNRIDNDFGESTKKAIIDFQKDQGLTADGGAGTATFQKMIDWLKKNN